MQSFTGLSLMVPEIIGGGGGGEAKDRPGLLNSKKAWPEKG